MIFKINKSCTVLLRVFLKHGPVSEERHKRYVSCRGLDGKRLRGIDVAWWHLWPHVAADKPWAAKFHEMPKSPQNMENHKNHENYKNYEKNVYVMFNVIFMHLFNFIN